MPDYEVIELEDGDEYDKSMSSGETWENVLIDVTNGGRVRIFAQVSGSCTIRNIGIRGQLDSRDYTSNFIPCYTSDTNGTVTIENCYFGDGFVDSDTYGPSDDPSGLSLRPEHAGHLIIDRMTMHEFPDNGLYMSSAGRWEDGQGGSFEVRNSHFEDNMTSDIRPGTDGVIENCGLYGNPHRGLWANRHIDDGGYQTIRDCHIDSGGSRAIAIGNNNWPGGENNGLMIEEDVYMTGDIDLYNSGNWYEGEIAGEASYHPPSHFGAPESAEEAAGGEPPEPIEVGHIDDDFAHEDLAANYQGDLDGFEILGGE